MKTDSDECYDRPPSINRADEIATVSCIFFSSEGSERNFQVLRHANFNSYFQQFKIL